MEANFLDLGRGGCDAKSGVPGNSRSAEDSEPVMLPSRVPSVVEYLVQWEELLSTLHMIDGGSNVEKLGVAKHPNFY
ncbi:hypothetical protein C5167_041360 [Papaver somniferum]|nr:hypothetical protein C5167_041360 [Papaver somniferum]